MTALPRGLYVITDSRFGNVTVQAQAALAGGARLIQYRDKTNSAQRRLHEARELAALCGPQDVPLIINDDVELALASGAGGVHVGRDDAALVQARARLGPDAIIGVSCYNQFERAEQAVADGASYVAFGRFFPSTSKPDAVHASPDLLTRACQKLALPAVAIGGITPDNGGALLTAGAQMLAVIEAVVGQPDITCAARRFSQLFEPGGPSQ